MDLTLNNLQWLICKKKKKKNQSSKTNLLFWRLTVCKQKLYLCQTELFEIELFSHLIAYKQKKLYLGKTKFIETFIKMS